jgi:hypothetical protein
MSIVVAKDVLSFGLKLPHVTSKVVVNGVKNCGLCWQPCPDPGEHPLHHRDRVRDPEAEGGHPGEDSPAVLQLLEAGRPGPSQFLPHAGRWQKNR